MQDASDVFVSLSAALTGFDVSELRATAMVPRYLATVLAEADEDQYRRLVETAENLDAVDDPDVLDLARAITHLWYLGVWPGPEPFTVSPRAYAEGLVWKALHTNAPGAVPSGFGSWSRPPRTHA